MIQSDTVLGMPDDVPTIRELEAFRAAAVEGTFSAAAVSMQTSPARVRGNVVNLEKKLRLKPNSLLVSVSGRVKPSPQGAALLQVAGDVLDDIDRLRREAGLVREGHVEQLRIGCYPAHLRFVAPAIMRFQEERPSSRVEIAGASDEMRGSGGWTLLSQLIEGRLDFAIAPDRFEIPDYLARDSLYSWSLLVADETDSVSAVSISALRQETLLVSPPGHTSHEMLRVACLAAGFSPHFAVESTSTEGLASLARAGLGLVILPSDATYLHRDLSWRSLIDDEGSELQGAYCLYRPRRLSDGGMRLKELLVQEIASTFGPERESRTVI